MTKPGPELEILRGIRMLITDVDGVLTDGRLLIDSDGRETRSFHVHDIAGLYYWHRSGGLSGFLSGRATNVVEEHARTYGVTEIHLGHLDKSGAFAEILTNQSLTADQVAYIGDDLLDLVALDQAGFAIAPSNARDEVKERVHYVTEATGGFGVLREAIEYILKAQGKWDIVVEKGGLP